MVHGKGFIWKLHILSADLSVAADFLGKILENNFSVETKKGGFLENKSLKSRLTIEGSVVQVLSTKKNIFLFALENLGTKNPETVVVSGFSGAISFLVAQHGT